MRVSLIHRKDKGGVYYVRVSYVDPNTGKISTWNRSTGETVRANALRKKYLLLTTFKAHYERTDRQTASLGDFVADYVAEVRETRSYGHYKNVRRVCGKFVAQIGPDTQLHRVATLDINRHLSSLRSTPTRHGVRLILHALFERAVVADLVTKNPVKAAIRVKLPDPDTHYITPDEFSRILETLPYDRYKHRVHRNMIGLAFQTGLRLTEAVFVRESDIETGRAGFVLRVANTLKHNTKSGKVRFVPLSDAAMAFVEDQRKAKSERDDLASSEYLFADNSFGSGRVCGRYASIFVGKYARKLYPDKHLSFKSLRTSFGANLLRHGFAMEQISAFLGHSSIAVTEKHYAKLMFLDHDTDAVRSGLNAALR